MDNTTGPSNWIRVWALAAAIFLPTCPLATSYVMHICILIFLYMILALGLNIVPGFNGLLDLGYVGFYGIGAYTAGLLTVHFGLSYWIIIPAGRHKRGASGASFWAPPP